jgi:S-formylglutathione hydrolase
MLQLHKETQFDDASEQGTGDKFLEQGQLLPENFRKAARAAGYDEAQVSVRSQEGYDHSYYFVCMIASNHFT